MTFFPAIVEGPGSDGGYCAEVLGTSVLGQGNSDVEALTDALLSLQEIIEDYRAGREACPEPTRPTEEDRARGTLALLQAHIPAQAA